MRPNGFLMTQNHVTLGVEHCIPQRKVSNGFKGQMSCVKPQGRLITTSTNKNCLTAPWRKRPRHGHTNI